MSTTQAQERAHQEWIDKVMGQAQVFASCWSLVGGRFDSGDVLETAEAEKTALRAMLATPPSSAAPKNEGHGHVVPRPDGVKARCGGPAFCRVCQREKAAPALQAAENEDAALLDAMDALIEAQDALDNREINGINADNYFVLLRRRNAARKHFEAVCAARKDKA